MKLSLSRLNFLNIFATALIFSSAVGFFVINTNIQSYQRHKQQIEQRYIKENKELARNETRRVAKRIEYTKKMVYARLRSNLKDKVEFVSWLLVNEQKNHPSDTPTQLIQRLNQEIDAFRWDHKSGYVYILSKDGEILYHADKRYIGKNVSILANNNQKLQNFFKDAFKQDEYYGNYSWERPDLNNQKQYDKYVYIKKVKPLHVYIAAGIYTTEIDKDIKSVLLNELKQERYGHNKYGYFWVHDLNCTMLEHPINPELVGKDVSNLKTEDGKSLFKTMNELVLKQNEGFLQYQWQRPDNKGIDQKISYICLIKDWGWVVGSGFYFSELKDMIAAENTEAHSAMNSAIKEIVIVLAVMIFISLIVAKLLSEKISKIEKEQKIYFDQLEQYKEILDSTAVVSKTDTNGKITYVNDKFCDVTGYCTDEIIGKNHNIVRHPQTPKELFKDLWDTIKKGQKWHGIIKNRAKSGSSYYNDTTIIPLKDENGNISEYISCGVNLTELIENREKLNNAFMTDTLTGLGSRLKLLSSIKETQKAILALIDISRFSEINDLKGHAFGDKVIIECGQRLFAYFTSKKYTLFRVHSDVFAVFSREVEMQEFISKVKEFVSNDSKHPYIIDGEELVAGYNAGIAEGYGDILTLCDMALRNAKISKESSVIVFSSDVKNIEKYKENLEWVAKLNKALDEDMIVPYFQPIYNYHTGKIEKFECLVRLLENGNTHPPCEFLDIAKKTKLYPRLTYKMIEKSIDMFSKNNYEFSINLTVDDILQQELIVYLMEYAAKNNVMDRMVIEVVESEEMQNYDEVINTIKKLKLAGAKIAIDDFGSGYSNYDYLVSLQADYVKIDASLVKMVCKDKRTKDVISAIVDFAKKYDMKTIAEFVSDEDIDKEIRSLGIDYAQGYLYGKPEAKLI